ncbi:HAMP domain-containing protein [Candidatus Bipolaricaulota bacterium]|nr:HAMP domain-containing protein [Candidatus Bipolaricaulota bacterium]
MRRRIPLAAKLSVSFILVILLAVALIYVLTTWSITRQFEEYRRTSRAAFGKEVAALLANYRGEEHTWVGVGERVLMRPYIVRLGEESLVGNVPIFAVEITLFDIDGHLISSNAFTWLNRQERDENNQIWLSMSDTPSEESIPIMVSSQQEGTLFVGDIGNPGTAESVFLSTVTESALIGGGIAIALALFLTTILIVQILRPLRTLSRATERVAEGDMPDQVTVRTHDELGRLGDSFNHMLESLKRSETVRQTMTADIAHELRTPVTIIQGTLEAILDGIYDASEGTIAPIYDETLHLGQLIDDLRDLALAEAGELRLEKEPVDIVELIHQVSETAFLSREDSPNLHLDTPALLPKVLLDRKRFRQVIANLLSNAIRFTPEDGDVYIRVRRIDGEIEMSVADTGPGIKPEDLPHLFERFYRADPARGRSAGSGLGLAIVKQWVEAHDGTIEAENLKSGGARFVIRLPLA